MWKTKPTRAKSICTSASLFAGILLNWLSSRPWVPSWDFILFCLEKGQQTETKDNKMVQRKSLSFTCPRLPSFSFSPWDISQGLYTRRCRGFTLNLICKCHRGRNNKVKNESVKSLKLLSYGEMERKSKDIEKKEKRDGHSDREK